MNNDAPRLRRALGQFATGVTVVTAAPADADGAQVGVTINSFTSVSLDPPLVLWCLDRAASCVSAFRTAEHFCINVLNRDQRHLCDRFAATTGDKFTGLDVGVGVGGVPLLAGCLAWFECARHDAFDAGDHTVILGRVIRFSAEPGQPLVFFAGGFPGLADR